MSGSTPGTAHDSDPEPELYGSGEAGSGKSGIELVVPQVAMIASAPIPPIDMASRSAFIAVVSAEASPLWRVTSSRLAPWLLMTSVMAWGWVGYAAHDMLYATTWVRS